MTRERCPTCGREVLATAIRGPSSVVLTPCGYEIADESQLREDGDLDPLTPDEWLIRLLADADGD